MTSKNSSQQQHGSDLPPPTTEYSKCGYDINNIEELSSRFICIFCFLLIREPIQLECGDRCCRGCFEVRAAVAPNGNITCPRDDCQEITNKNKIMPDKAFKRELDVLQVECMHQKDKICSWEGQLKDYQIHLDENHSRYTCSNCDESFSTQAALDEHLNTECSKFFEKCSFGVVCSEDMIHKTEFHNHVLTEKHQETVVKFLTGEHHIPDTSNREQDIQINTELEDRTSEKLNNLTHEIQKLNDETVQLNTSFQILQQSVNSTVQELNNLFATFNERTPIKQIIQPKQDEIQKDIEQVYDLCNNTQHISTDGTLTWRIENVSEKMADAQSERQTSIYSPIFYSSPTGYKMRARLFLFGDGNARRTHISLFFLLMKGEYDGILKWPFHYKVTFCLLDQTGNNRHIIDSFYPDVKSNSFQRPKDAANIASGIPKFFPLPMLLQDDNAYVRENTLYIKIIIALNETPKTLLPFMLTLNPALPNYVQENLISQEAAKQQQQQLNTMSSS